MDARIQQRLRLASSIGYWMGAVLLIPGVGILAAAFAVYALLFAGWLQGLF